jgi:ketosteroid isomerase-like protein
MGSADWQGFLTRFSDFGNDPTPERYLNLFDPQGTVQHPGMARALTRAEIPGFIGTALSTMPDFRLRPVYGCARGEVLFVEAASSGTVRGTHVTWPAMYCVNLHGDRVIRGRAYYDRAAVLSGFEPDLAGRRNEAHARALSDEAAGDDGSSGLHVDAPAIETELVEPYVANWRAPRAERFPEFYAHDGRLLVPGVPHALSGDAIADYYRDRLAETQNLQLRCETRMARASRVFFEWRMTGSIAGRSFDFGAAECLTLDGNRIVEGISYFDTLSLRSLHDPSIVARTIFDRAQ